jgi:hypothetical protein
MPVTSSVGSKLDSVSETAQKKICLAIFLTEMVQFHKMIFNISGGQTGGVMRHEEQYSTDFKNTASGVRMHALKNSACHLPACETLSKVLNLKKSFIS